jgi:antitoxin MazE
VRVEKWDDSLAVRLPPAMVEALGLTEGDEIEIHIVGGPQPAISPDPGRAELLRRLRAFRGRLPGDFRFDRV